MDVHEYYAFIVDSYKPMVTVLGRENISRENGLMIVQGRGPELGSGYPGDPVRAVVGHMREARRAADGTGNPTARVELLGKAERLRRLAFAAARRELPGDVLMATYASIIRIEGEAQATADPKVREGLLRERDALKAALVCGSDVSGHKF